MHASCSPSNCERGERSLPFLQETAREEAARRKTVQREGSCSLLCAGGVIEIVRRPRPATSKLSRRKAHNGVSRGEPSFWNYYLTRSLSLRPALSSAPTTSLYCNPFSTHRINPRIATGYKQGTSIAWNQHPQDGRSTTRYPSRNGIVSTPAAAAAFHACRC